jgi:hypothetical protein
MFPSPYRDALIPVVRGQLVSYFCFSYFGNFAAVHSGDYCHPTEEYGYAKCQQNIEYFFSVL